MKGFGFLYKAEKWFQIHLGKHPALFFFVYRLARNNPLQVVTQETDIVIEGFPRSANSFAVVALRQAQKRNLRIASNLHVPAQVLRAAKWRIPALVVIRPPRDAVLSLMIRDGISANQALLYYIAFYETLAKHRDAFVLGSFDEVTRNYGAVIKRVNERFGTAFTPFRHTQASLDKAFFAVDAGYRSYNKNSLATAVSRPTTAKDKAKRHVEGQLENARCKRLLSRAEVIYMRLITEGT
jgi:hypothetical protein